MIDDPLSLLSMGIWLFAAGMWPVAFLFGACSACCDQDQCPWIVGFDRCLRFSIVGSSPPSGGHCLVLSERSGLVVRGQSPIEIHLVPSQIRITVRISISASGASRTPIGDTRTQVWRFNRATPTSPAATAYDVLGPAWHLEVELSVTGVATEAEAGVTTSIGMDSEGQPKLFVVVNQWTATITRDEVVTLFPVGLQRWGPGLTGTQTFRLSGATATATRVSGDNYSGWTVSKLSGLTTDQSTLAVRVIGDLCQQGGTIAETIVLNDNTAIGFLNGDQELVVSVPSGSRSLRIEPINSLCGVASLSVGIALGVYPEVVSRPPPVGPGICDKGPINLRVFESCATGYRSSWNYRGVNFTGSNSLGPASPLFSSTSLLWNIEHGPISSFGEPGDDKFDRLPGPCPEGKTLPDPLNPNFFTVTNAFNLCTGIGSPCEIEYEIEYGTSFIEQGESLFQSGTISGTIERGSDDASSLTVTLACIGTGQFQATIEGQEETVTVAARHEVAIPRPCDEDGTLSLSEGTQESSQVSLGLGFPGTPLFNPFFIIQKKVTSSGSVGFSDTTRRFCGSWSTPPTEGGTITRTCDVSGFASESRFVRPLLSRFPTYLGLSGVEAGTQVGVNSIDNTYYTGPAPPLQPGSCVSRGLAPAADGTPIGSQVAATAGQCFFYKLLFGPIPHPPGDSTFQNPRGCDVSATPHSATCDGCTPSVSIDSGSEYASVRYIEAGSKAGLIEVVAKTTWLGGQGVDFTVTCGNIVATKTLRRANTAPTPPQNLTVVRGPCSEAFLEWQAPAWDGGQPITAYNIQFRRIGVSSFTTFGTVAGSSLSATVTGLVRVGYQFQVQALNGIGSGSSFSNLATSGFLLGAPTNLTFTRDPCDQIQLSWTPPTQQECVVAASQLVQFRVTGTSPWTTAATLDGNAATHNITNLGTTTRYQMRVGSVDEAGVEQFSGFISSGLNPAFPSGVVGSLGQNAGEVNLVWNAVEQQCFPNTDYLVQFRPDTTTTWSDFARAASADKFATVTGLTAGVTYFFRVRATNSVGNSGFSVQSQPVSIPFE